MLEAVRITAYKCPFCSKISMYKKSIELHAETCCGNPDYTQKCINCSSLNSDFVISNLYGKGVCFRTGPYGHGCPYVNHDRTEVDLEIERQHDAYVKYSSYDSSRSPQDNWKKEDEYDQLRNNGIAADEAKRIIYGS